VFGILFDVADVEAVVKDAVKTTVPKIVPLPDKELDDAIDEAINPIMMGDAIYSASELLYHTDYDAYRDLVTTLLDENEQGRRERIA
jgi:hypothetical protein